MKVFLSWSGTTSRLVAEALGAWLPKVIQGVEPFVSAKDIDKGSNWTVELARELEDTEFGIVCLAPDNLLSPWLNYEAGAITRSVNSRVCPVLLGVEKLEVKPPLSQLQMTSFDIDDVTLLMTAMNKIAGEPLTTDALRESVEVWWPRLEQQIQAIRLPDAETGPNVEAPEPAKPVVDVGEMVEEVLHRVRALDDRVRRIERRNGSAGGPASEGQRRYTAATRHLRNILRSEGVGVESVLSGPTSIDLRIESDLPDELPSAVLGALVKVAQVEGIRLRLIASNKSFVFEKDGNIDVLPS